MSEDKERTAIRRIDPDKYFAIRRKERRPKLREECDINKSSNKTKLNKENKSINELPTTNKDVNFKTKVVTNNEKGFFKLAQKYKLLSFNEEFKNFSDEDLLVLLIKKLKKEVYLERKQKIMEVLAFIVENNKDLKNFLRLKEGIKVILSILSSKNEDLKKSSGRLLLKTCEDNHFNKLEIIMNNGTRILTEILANSPTKEHDSVILEILQQLSTEKQACQELIKVFEILKEKYLFEFAKHIRDKHFHVDEYEDSCSLFALTILINVIKISEDQACKKIYETPEFIWIFLQIVKSKSLHLNITNKKCELSLLILERLLIYTHSIKKNIAIGSTETSLNFDEFDFERDDSSVLLKCNCFASILCRLLSRLSVDESVYLPSYRLLKILTDGNCEASQNMGKMIFNSHEFMERFLITGIKSHNNVCLSPVIYVLKNLMQNNDFKPCDDLIACLSEKLNVDDFFTMNEVSQMQFLKFLSFIVQKNPMKCLVISSAGGLRNLISLQSTCSDEITEPIKTKIREMMSSLWKYKPLRKQLMKDGFTKDEFYSFKDYSKRNKHCQIS